MDGIESGIYVFLGLVFFASCFGLIYQIDKDKKEAANPYIDSGEYANKRKWLLRRKRLKRFIKSVKAKICNKAISLFK